MPTDKLSDQAGTRTFDVMLARAHEHAVRVGPGGEARIAHLFDQNRAGFLILGAIVGDWACTQQLCKKYLSDDWTNGFRWQASTLLITAREL